MGPINEWFISGFDGGENALIGFSTGECVFGSISTRVENKSNKLVLHPICMVW